MLGIFIHIPKTAGTTFRHIAEKQLGKDKILAIYGDDILEAGTIVHKSFKADEAAYEMVRGHISFGCHRTLPPNAPFRYFTIVREPVARVLSLYNYIQRSGNHPMNAEVKKMTFDGFVMSGISLETDNGQVRQLCGHHGEFPQEPYGKAQVPFGQMTQEHLRQTFNNLIAFFSVVGVCERFDDTLRAFCRELGWPVEPYKSHNITGRGIRLRDLPQKTIQKVRRQNLLDMELWKWAKERLP